MNQPSFIAAVISHTPIWVWALLALLVALGARQMVTQVASRERVLALPIALGALSLWGATGAFGVHALVQGPWLLGIAAGLMLNQTLQLPRRVRALPGDRFEIGGSAVPLALMMAVFCTRYVVGAALAVVPALATQASFAAVASVVYGVPTGLFAARAARVLATARDLLPAAA